MNPTDLPIPRQEAAAERASHRQNDQPEMLAGGPERPVRRDTTYGVVAVMALLPAITGVGVGVLVVVALLQNSDLGQPTSLWATCVFMGLLSTWFLSSMLHIGTYVRYRGEKVPDGAIITLIAALLCVFFTPFVLHSGI